MSLRNTNTYSEFSESSASNKNIKHIHDATIFESIFNLTSACIGAGFLSFPYAFKCSGIISASFITLFFCFLTYYSLIILSDKSLSVANKRDEAYTPESFEDLIRYYLGNDFYWITITMIVLGIIGTLCAYLLIMVELCIPLLALVASPSSFWGGRAFILIIFCSIVIPLCSLKSLKSLTWSSVAAVVSLLFVSVVLIVFLSKFGAENGKSDYLMFNGQFSIFLALPIIVFAWGCQIQYVIVYVELHPNDKNHESLHLINIVAMSLCLVVYLVIGCLGYFTFGSSTKSVILANFSESDVFFNVVRFIMAMHIACAFPLQYFPIRRGLRLLFTCDVKAADTSDYDTSLGFRVLMSFAVIFICAVFAYFVPKIALVFGFFGSTSFTFIQFLLPGLLLMQPVAKLAPLSYAVRERLEKLKLKQEAESKLEMAENDNVSIAEADKSDMSIHQELTILENKDSDLKKIYNSEKWKALPVEKQIMAWVFIATSGLIFVTGVLANVDDIYHFINIQS